MFTPRIRGALVNFEQGGALQNSYNRIGGPIKRRAKTMPEGVQLHRHATEVYTCRFTFKYECNMNAYFNPYGTHDLGVQWSLYKPTD